MLISLNWIRDFVDLPDLTPAEVAETFSLSTAEVEKVIEQGGHLEQVTVVELTKIDPHPNAEKLRLATFTLGGNEEKQVVCGAPDLKIGMKVPYAPIGTTLPNGLTLEPKKIRGVLSDGMLCSPVELEVGEDASGIWELPTDATIGSTLAEHLGAQLDTLFDIDNKSLTHRPDLWGHLGMAREFSAVFNCSLRDPYDQAWLKQLEDKTHSGTANPISLEVKPESCCIGYYGISVDNVKVAPSPKWMQDRLTATGLRPINNLVDIGNYVMLEVGGPLHMFDQAKIRKDKIVIEALENDTDLLLLDGTTAKLLAGETVVSDGEGPLVIGGIMGGESSGVADDTTSIYIEAANWDPGSIRRTSTRLGVRTDSSQRFEKGLDTRLVKRTILRALQLVLELCPEATVAGELQYDGVPIDSLPTETIDTSTRALCALLGKEIAAPEVVRILEALDFTVQAEGEKLTVTVPSYRSTREFKHEADLAEEVGRIVGYNSITPSSPKSDIRSTRLSPVHHLHRKIEDFLVLHGKLLQVQTQPLVGTDLLRAADWSDQDASLKLLNPVSQDQDRMRPSLVPSLLATAHLNQKYYHRFSFFELARTYSPPHKKNGDEIANEQNHLGIALFDRDGSRFLELANLIERLMVSLGWRYRLEEPGKIKGNNTALPKDWAGLHPQETLELSIMGQLVGGLTTVHPLLLQRQKVKGALAIGVINLAAVEERGVISTTTYEPLPKYPSATFDCTVSVPPRTEAQKLIDVVQKTKLPELVDIRVKDLFEPSGDERHITLRSTFRDADKTLSKERVRECEEAVMAALDKGGFPLKSS